jgi:hypothetical protein
MHFNEILNFLLNFPLILGCLQEFINLIDFLVQQSEVRCSEVDAFDEEGVNAKERIENGVMKRNRDDLINYEVISFRPVEAIAGNKNGN